MPDGVDTTMKAMKSAGRDAPVDPTRREAELPELPTPHHAVLCVGQLGDLTVTWTVLTTHIVVKIVHVSHSTHRATNFVTCG